MALSSSFAFSCRHTDSRLLGTCFAGVGKHAAKLAYELARSVRARASEKTCCRRDARGPGVRGTGAGGGGEGDAALSPLWDVVEGIVGKIELVL